MHHFAKKEFEEAFEYNEKALQIGGELLCCLMLKCLLLEEFGDMEKLEECIKKIQYLTSD